MKIILLSKFQKLGEVGQVANVKAGFARNYLIPKGIAIAYNENAFKALEEKKQALLAEDQKRIEAAQIIHQAIDAKSIKLLENAADDGRLYGAVNSSEIAKKINEVSGQEISRSQISLEAPIKNIGTYNVTINLHPEVKAKVELEVVRSLEE